MTAKPGSATPQKQRRGPERRIDGVLAVDKPEGMTSMDVVRRIKRASRVKKVGHGGTLDPFATGVIAVCMGQATRLMEYLVDSPKTYRGVVELGIETDTYDVQGEVTAQRGRLWSNLGAGRGPPCPSSAASSSRSLPCTAP